MSPQHSILFIFCALIASFSALHADDFQAGIDAYHESDYAQAAESFQQALSTEESAAAHHNLALSLYQQGKPAEAAWQLERAARLDPLNKSYLYKLGALRQQLGLYRQPVEWWQAASRLLPQNIWGWIASLSLWILLAAWLLPRMGGFGRRPIALKILMSIAITAIILCSAALTIQQSQQATGIIVSNDSVRLNYAPAAAAPEVGLARPGERARLVDRHNDYLKIATEAKIIGWIQESQFRSL